MFITKTAGNTLCYTHKMEYYSATKKEQNIDTFSDLERSPKHHVAQKECQLHVSSYGKFKKQINVIYNSGNHNSGCWCRGIDWKGYEKALHGDRNVLLIQSEVTSYIHLSKFIKL